MHDKRELVERDVNKSIWHYRMTQSQLYTIVNKYNDDNVMYANVWFELFDGLF